MEFYGDSKDRELAREKEQLFHLLYFLKRSEGAREIQKILFTDNLLVSRKNLIMKTEIKVL